MTRHLSTLGDQHEFQKEKREKREEKKKRSSESHHHSGYGHTFCLWKDLIVMVLT
jgi:hypothetical protein